MDDFDNKASLDSKALEQRLDEFRGCKFEHIQNRSDIEELVAEYLTIPHLQTQEFTRRLVYLLFVSEWEPTKRVVRGTMTVSGVPLKSWIWWLAGGVVVGLILMLRSLDPFSVAFVMIWVGIYLYQRWRLQRLFDDVNFLINRELVNRTYDPATLITRIRYFEENRGLKIHSNIYALLRLLERHD